MAIYILGPDPNGDCCTCAERVNVCDTCSPVTGSCCALYLPPPTASASPYSTLTGAQYAVANQVNNCIGYIDRLTDVNSFTASQAAGQLTLGVSVTYVDEPSSSMYPRLWGSIALAAGDVVSVSSTQPAFSYLYDCDGNLLDTVLTNGNFIAAPSEAGYMLEVFPQWPSVAGSYSLTVTFSNANLIVNPVIALWDDSGTTRQLEACPKMLLPPLTESTGDWYADCASAASAISVRVENCIGYISSVNFVAFTASNSPLTLYGWGDSDTATYPQMWAGVNLVAGSVLSIAYDCFTNHDPLAVITAVASIYDDAGTLIQTMSTGPAAGWPTHLTGTFVFNPVSYTGRYIVYVQCVCVPSGSSSTMPEATFVVTSNDTISVNPIQALYDTGLTCPARLDCGDTC